MPVVTLWSVAGLSVLLLCALRGSDESQHRDDRERQTEEFAAWHCSGNMFPVANASRELTFPASADRRELTVVNKPLSGRL